MYMQMKKNRSSFVLVAITVDNTSNENEIIIISNFKKV